MPSGRSALPATATVPIGEASRIVQEIRKALVAGGSPIVATAQQKFFRDPIRSHGWKTAALRRFAHEWRRRLLKERGFPFVLEAADQLFQPGFEEEKTFAIFLLEQSPAKLSDSEFRLFESWLDRVENWGDHDGLTIYLIGPMMLAKPQRVKRVRHWARSRNLWHRRAAAVSLIRGIRRGLFWEESQAVAGILLSDQELVVQKGLGWMLREASKANPRRTVPFLMSIRERTSRLVLRTACETLEQKVRKRVLERT